MKTTKKAYQKSAFPVLWLSSAALLGLLTQCPNYMTDESVRDILVKLLCWVIAVGGFLCWKRKSLDLHDLKISDRSDTGFYVVSGVFLFVAVLFFHASWCFYGYMNSTLGRSGIQYAYLSLWLPIALAVCALPALVVFLKSLLKDYLDVRHSVWEEHRHLSKLFLVLAGVFCVSIIAILRANLPYKDDFGRLANGFTLYGRESRFAAEFVTMFLHFDRFFADTSPLPQLLEMIVMALAAVIVFAAVNPKKKASIYDVFSLIPFALTPYFLECVSFKYDPPQHAFAVLFAVIPFLFVRSDRKKFLLATFLCMPIMCMFHQVPMAFYPSVVILMCMLSWNRGEWTARETAVFAGQSAGAYIAGMLVYRFGIMSPLPAGGNYTSTEMWDAKDMLSGIIENYRLFFNRIFEDFHPIWLVLICALCAAFIVLFAKSSTRKKVAALGVGIVGAFLLLMLSYSLYPLLKLPQYSPRHMYAFGLFVGLVSVAAVSLSGEKGFVTKTSAMVLGCAFIVFSFLYGNALQEQKDYAAYRTAMVLDTVSEITSENPERTYYLDVQGSIGYAPAIEAMPEALNMVRTLVPTILDAYYASWEASGLDLYGLNIQTIVDDPLRSVYAQNNMYLYEQNYYHSIYVNGNYILVILNDR